MATESRQPEPSIDSLQLAHCVLLLATMRSFPRWDAEYAIKKVRDRYGDDPNIQTIDYEAPDYGEKLRAIAATLEQMPLPTWETPVSYKASAAKAMSLLPRGAREVLSQAIQNGDGAA